MEYITLHLDSTNEVELYFISATQAQRDVFHQVICQSS